MKVIYSSRYSLGETKDKEKIDADKLCGNQKFSWGNLLVYNKCLYLSWSQSDGDSISGNVPSVRSQIIYYFAFALSAVRNNFWVLNRN